VDDEDLLRSALQASLEQLGYPVIAAANGEAALVAYAEHRPAIDVVVLDLIMPGLDGEDVYRRQRALGSGVPVLLISGNADARRVQGLLAEGVAAFLCKLFDVETLVATVAGVIENPGALRSW
jgi:two-component system cell cycle sensor histidine kinase/response regulator CckA